MSGNEFYWVCGITVVWSAILTFELRSIRRTIEDTQKTISHDMKQLFAKFNSLILSTDNLSSSMDSFLSYTKNRDLFKETEMFCDLRNGESHE